MSGRDNDRGAGDGSERIDVDPLVVDRHRRETQPFSLQDRVVEGKAGLLHGDGRGALSMQEPRQLAEAAACAGDHRCGVGGRRCVACSVQVAGDRGPELDQPGRFAVAEQVVGSGRQHLASAAQPCPTREEAAVGLARDQVEPEVRARRFAHVMLDGPRPGRDTRRGALTSCEVALRDELVVGGNDRGACQLEVGGQSPSRWHGLPGRESSRRGSRRAVPPRGCVACGCGRCRAAGRGFQLVRNQRGRLDQALSPARP